MDNFVMLFLLALMIGGALWMLKSIRLETDHGERDLERDELRRYVQEIARKQARMKAKSLAASHRESESSFAG